MARILCIETSGGVASVALAVDGVCVAVREELGNDASHRLTTFIQELGVGVGGFDAVAVSAGPGSYTGLRIGVSLAKGLCYASGKPLIAIGTLDALAQGVEVPEGIENLVGLIDARRMEVYAAHFSVDKRRTSETTAVVVEDGASLAITNPQTTLCFGSGAAKCGAVVGGVEVVDVPLSARWLCGVAERKLSQGETEDVAYFEPNYIKEFVALTSQKKLW